MYYSRKFNPKHDISQRFSIEDLQKIAKYFKIFDSIEDVFEDFRQKFSTKNF